MLQPLQHRLHSCLPGINTVQSPFDYYMCQQKNATALFWAKSPPWVQVTFGCIISRLRSTGSTKWVRLISYSLTYFIYMLASFWHVIWWRQHVSPKHWYVSPKLHGATSHTTIIMFTDIKTSYLIQFCYFMQMLMFNYTGFDKKM